MTNIMVHILQIEKRKLKLRRLITYPVILLLNNLMRFKPRSIIMQ